MLTCILSDFIFFSDDLIYTEKKVSSFLCALEWISFIHKRESYVLQKLFLLRYTQRNILDTIIMQ